jgi:pyridinium-3,5-bisthiocarboxylic acid mononucleotide nickel chelatase
MIICVRQLCDMSAHNATMIAYFDCFSGISGDMVLGALVDTGCGLDRLETELRRLPISGWKVSAAKVSRCGLMATQVQVSVGEDHGHRSLPEILQLIEGAGFSPRVAERASQIFRRLGEAEAHVHGIPVERVHFHEVGAADAIVDIVGTCIGLDLLGIDEVSCSSLNVGGGTVDSQHGTLPVPAPATAELLRGAPTYSTGIERELVTPTGAAIASALTSQYGPQPPMKVASVGYGAGATALKGQANVLRLFLGERITRERTIPLEETVVILEANLDDMNPQIHGYFVDRALEAGALDVFTTPVHMKKNRPGLLVTLLCEPSAVDLLTELIFRETTTIGVRTYTARRRKLEREIVPVDTPLGSIRVKVARLDGDILNASPEYGDCEQIAAKRGMPLKHVMAEAAFHFQRLHGSMKKPRGI